MQLDVDLCCETWIKCINLHGKFLQHCAVKAYQRWDNLLTTLQVKIVDCNQSPYTQFLLKDPPKWPLCLKLEIGQGWVIISEPLGKYKQAHLKQKATMFLLCFCVLAYHNFSGSLFLLKSSLETLHASSSVWRQMRRVMVLLEETF